MTPARATGLATPPADSTPAAAGPHDFAALLNALPCVAFILLRGRDGAAPTFSYVSERCAELLGLPAADLLLDPTTLLDRMLAADGAALLREIERAFEQRSSWRTRIHLSAGGAERTMMCHGTVPPGAAPEQALGCLYDIGDRVEADRQALLWSSVFQQSAEGVMICDRQKRIVLVNPAFERLTGYTYREIVGKTPRELHSGRQSAGFYRAMWQAIRQQGRWQGEIWNRRKSGEIYAEWLSIHAVVNDRRKVTHYIGVFSDMSQRKAAEARIQHLADYDALTDLPNRASMMLRLRQCLASADRVNGKVGLLCVDLDRFSNVNDSLGHAAGDLLLKAAAARLLAIMRNTDTVARMGADEFAIVLPDVRDADDVASAATKILNALRMPFDLHGQPVTTSASIGICLYPGDGHSEEDLLRNASAAMNRAKRAGRNTCELYAPEMNRRAAEQLQLENALREALERDQLVLHYQPQLDLASGRIVGAEALVRWERPGVGLVPPGTFIPLAQESGLILPIGRWVMRRALRQLAEWNAAGLAGFTVAVNLTATEFHDVAVVTELAALAREHGIEPARVELELTESIAVQDVDSTRRMLHALNEQGFKLSLDDFGTGYSSLNYLRHFPIDKIKIDRSFVSELPGQASAFRIVRAIVALAKSFGIRVLAEGVETREQLQALRAERCDEIQGFLVSPALPPAELERLMTGWDAARYDLSSRHR